MTYDAQLMKKIGIDLFSGAGGLSLGGAMAELRFAMLLRLILTQPNLLNLITKEQK